jgi:hypothetical protein
MERQVFQGGLSEDQTGFLLFLADLSDKQLRSTYLSYCFLAEFNRADEIWKRDAARLELMRRHIDVPAYGAANAAGCLPLLDY